MLWNITGLMTWRWLRLPKNKFIVNIFATKYQHKLQYQIQ
jgi:hypothetical protein